MFLGVAVALILIALAWWALPRSDRSDPGGLAQFPSAPLEAPVAPKRSPRPTRDPDMGFGETPVPAVPKTLDWKPAPGVPPAIRAKAEEKVVGPGPARRPLPAGEGPFSPGPRLKTSAGLSNAPGASGSASGGGSQTPNSAVGAAGAGRALVGAAGTARPEAGARASGRQAAGRNSRGPSRTGGGQASSFGRSGASGRETASGAGGPGAGGLDAGAGGSAVAGDAAADGFAARGAAGGPGAHGVGKLASIDAAGDARSSSEWSSVYVNLSPEDRAALDAACGSASADCDFWDTCRRAGIFANCALACRRSPGCTPPAPNTTTGTRTNGATATATGTGTAAATHTETGTGTGTATELRACPNGNEPTCGTRDDDKTCPGSVIKVTECYWCCVGCGTYTRGADCDHEHCTATGVPDESGCQSNRCSPHVPPCPR